MVNLKEIWNALNRGEIITNGEHALIYVNNVLSDVIGNQFSVIPFDADNCDEWYILEEEVTEQLYCRWYKEINGGDITILSTFYRIEREPTSDFIRIDEALTRSDILGK